MSSDQADNTPASIIDSETFASVNRKELLNTAMK